MFPRSSLMPPHLRPAPRRAPGVATAGAATEHWLVTRGAMWLVYAAALYPLVLCFLNTRVGRLPASAIIVAELLIAAAALPLLILRLNLGILLLMLAVCVNFFILALFQQSADFKALRDLLIPLLFVWVGNLLSDRKLAERVLRNVALIAVFFGLFEFVFPAMFGWLFDAIAFYQSRGFGGNNPFALTVLQVRPEGIGRSLLPFLGPRRMSSIFLEPVALGNFAVLTAAWALSMRREERREAAFLLVLAAAMIVMADARFGSISILVLVALRVSQLWRARFLAASLPILAVAMLVLVTWFGPREIHDNIVGRFQVSGRNLIDMSWTAWLGIPGAISMDAGYGYIVQRTGVLICGFLWFMFSLMPLKDDQARRFHFNVAVYIALNLCISGSSLFSLKTTAVMWLLLGSVIAHRSLLEGLRVTRPPTQPLSSMATA